MDRGEKKVSIVVAIYNGERYIDSCVKGILAQKYKNIECILVDDGSIDKTGEICDRYALEDSRIKVVHQANKGLSAARNAGTAIATGDYLVYFDVDDEVTDSLISDNVRLAKENNADVVMFGFWYYNVDLKQKISNEMPELFVGDDKQFFEKYLVESIKHEVFNAPWNKLYRVSFLKENGLHFYPEFPIYEDIIFASKMLQYAKKIVINPKMYYIYYVRSYGSLITKYVDRYFESVTKFYQNALEYCDRYVDNNCQIESFSTLYMRLVTTNLKQISCNKDLAYDKKCARIKEICLSKEVKFAVRYADMSGKRNLTRLLISLNSARAITLMYSVLKKIST